MTTLAKHITIAGAKNRPPILEKSMYDSWASRIRLFIKGKKHGRMMLDSIDNDDYDVQARNIILHGLPPDVAKHNNEYTRDSHQADQDMHKIGMTMQPSSSQYQFLNALPSAKEQGLHFDMKLAKSLYTTNYDQLHAYLSQHERHANENSLNSLDPSPSCTPNKVEVPKELPKVSMVNTSLMKLKNHLTGFDMVVKERTTAIAITEGTWGFEHTKACFSDEIIPFVKALKDIFNKFDQDLIDELTEVQNVFNQMEQAVEQHRLESKTFEVKMNQVLNENDRLLEQVINNDFVNIVMNSTMDNALVNVHECNKCIKLETELLNKKDFVEKETYDKLFRNYTNLEKHCISLIVNTQLNQEIFQRDNSVSNQSAPNFDQYFELNELKAQSQE
ncbi:hypothetical protein Tco_1053146 [Tanacetum coccineum]